MTFRRFVLWLTGIDLLALKPPKAVPGVMQFRFIPPPCWQLRLSSGDGMTFTLPRGPNVLHRLAQRIVLGFRWRMLL